MATPTAYSAERSMRSPARAAARRTAVRWDRVGRLALLVVLAVLVYLYVSAGVALLGSWSASRQDRAQLATLERENASLKAQRAELGRGYNVEAQARALGMGRQGEKLFIVKGLPRD